MRKYGGWIGEDGKKKKKKDKREEMPQIRMKRMNSTGKTMIEFWIKVWLKDTNTRHRGWKEVDGLEDDMKSKSKR